MLNVYCMVILCCNADVQHSLGCFYLNAKKINILEKCLNGRMEETFV